jgi:thiol-disulfide isomerase/thioredoxin
MVKTVSTEAQLKSTLASAGSKLVVVKFYAKRCPHCISFAPEFDAIASEYSSVVFVEVDVTINQVRFFLNQLVSS